MISSFPISWTLTFVFFITVYILQKMKEIIKETRRITYLTVSQPTLYTNFFVNEGRQSIFKLQDLCFGVAISQVPPRFFQSYQQRNNP